MTIQIAYVLVVYLIVVVLMCTNKFSIATCAVTCAVLLQVGGITTFEETWEGLINSSTVMMAAMFIVAAGLSRTSLLKRLSNNIVKPGSSDTKIMLGFGIMIFLLTSFTNGTNSLNIMLPIIYAVCKAQNRPASKFIQSCACLCQIWAGLIPLGGNAGSYAITNQMIENLGGEGNFTYFTQMIAKLPVGLAIMAAAILVNHRFAPSFTVEEQMVDNAKAVKATELTPQKEKLTILIFCATIVGLVTMSLTGGDSTIPPLIGALLMVFSGVLRPREIPNNMGLSVILCSVGMLPIAKALVNTGADVLISEAIDKLLAGTNSSFVVLLVFYVINSVLTQIMYNATVLNIFRPLAIIAAVSHGWDPTALVMACIMGSSSAMLTPMASNVTALGYNAGKYTMKQYFFGVLFLWFVALVAFMAWVPFAFPL